jgi:pimeloyl-ACP methyl ester carboxylesterase
VAALPEPFNEPLNAVQALEAAVEESSYDPVPPGRQRPARRWWGNHLAELRWQAELARLLVDPVFRGEGVPRGDGAPVLLIPGFLAGDTSLQVMAGWLGRLGYRARPAGILANVDCSDRETHRLERRLVHLHERTGRRVALVGHSRGGHFAKALARRRPELVSCAISLGSGLDTPFDISIPTKAAVAAFRTLHARTSDRVARNGCFTDCCRCRFAQDYAAPFPAEVPLTSIYSRGDGVVWWEACVVPYARCVEVSGSHVGLAFNRRVYTEVARTLAREACAAASVPEAASASSAGPLAASA